MFQRKILFLSICCFILSPVLSYSGALSILLPPHNFAAISGEIQAVPLTWSMHPNTKVAGYAIYRADSKESDFKEIAKLQSRYVTSYLDGLEANRLTIKILSKKKPLLDNKNYYYKIAAITSDEDTGSLSEATRATTAPRPSPPLNLRAFSGGAKTIAINWMPPNDKSVVGYRIYRKDSKDGELLSFKDISGRLALSYIDKGGANGKLEDGHEYYYTLSSLNQAKVESYITKVVSAKTKEIPLPVREITASRGNVKTIELNWTPAAASDIKHYVILKKRIDDSESEKKIKVPADSSSYLDENLPDGARYHYQVIIVDNDGLQSISSPTASGTTKKIPGAPSNINISASAGKIIVQWDNNPEVDIVKYEVYKISGFIGIMKKMGFTTENSFIDRNFKRGEKVSYKIVAIDADDLRSSKSDAVSITVPK